MPSNCCAVGCTNRNYKGSELVFYRIPSTKEPERRQKWLQAIGRVDWNENIIKNARVCSLHFISGNNFNFQHEFYIF